MKIEIVSECGAYHFSGIYAILNESKKKYYIGSSVDISSRIKAHLKSLNGKSHRNKELQNDFDSKDKFKIIILKHVKNEDTLLIHEAYYIGFYNSINNGYNILSPASNKRIKKQKEELKNECIS